MKILLYSDLHLHLWKQFGVDEKTGLPNRLLDQILVLRQIGKIIKDKQVKLVLNGGDTIHKVGEIPTEVLNLAYSEFEKWNVKQVFVPGNHDMIDRKDPKWYQFSSRLFSKGFSLAEDEDVGFKLKTIGYSDKVEDIEGYDVVILHKTPIGCKVGNYTFSDGVEWKKLSSKNKLVFFGHIHQRQELSNNCIVLGSPMHLNFGDTGDRGVYVIDTESWEVEFIKLKYKQFITVDKSEFVNNKDNYYRVYLGKGEKGDGIDNVVSVSVPSYYEERIKGENTLDILREWCEINEKDSTFFDSLEKIIKECKLYGGDVFKGKIDSVSIKDFISVGEAKYNIGKGFTFIEGETSSFTSNGAGKSSMFGDAIYWGLFGETTKGLKGDDVIRFDCKDCKVEIVLINKKKVKIIRTRKKGLSVFVDDKEIWEGERDSEKQKKIEETLLGFSKDFFKTASYFSQEDLKMLTLMGDTDRNNMIVNLLGFELYDTMYEKVSGVCKAIDLDIDDKLENKTLFENNVKFTIEKIKNLNEKKSFLEGELEKIEDRFSNSEKELNERADNIRKDIEILKGKTVKVEIKENNFDEEEARLNKIRETVSTNIVNIRSVLTKNEFIVSDFTSKEKKINSLGDKCPTCLNEISEEHKHEILGEYESEIEKARSIVEKNNKLLKAENEKLKKVESKERELNENKIKSEKEYVIFKRNSEDLAKYKEHVAEYEKKIKNLIVEKDNELKSMNENIDSIKSEVLKQMEEQNDNQKVIDNITKEIINQEKEMQVMQFWKDSFGSKGIKSLLLDRFCNEFNKIMVEYISTVSDGEISAVMSPRRILKSGEERNKLDILVYIGDKERSYQSLSGGEKRRVDVAICLALNEWCGKKFGIPSGFLGLVILDEVFSYIDKKGEESIANLLIEEGMKKSILVISHTNDLASYSDRIWKVKKDNGISVLEV